MAVAMLAAVLLAALALFAAGCGSDGETSSDSSSSAEPIKIGAILSLTGTYAGLGEPEKNLIEMEVKKINDAGGINGRPIEVIIEDDATDEAQAVAAASRLIEQENVVAIIGATGTGQTMAMRGDVQRAGIPQVSMAGGTVITNPVDPLVFATPWSNTIVVPFTLDYHEEPGHHQDRPASPTAAGSARTARPCSRRRPPRPASRSSPTRRSTPATPT